MRLLLAEVSRNHPTRQVSRKLNHRQKQKQPRHRRSHPKQHPLTVRLHQPLVTKKLPRKPLRNRLKKLWDDEAAARLQVPEGFTLNTYFSGLETPGS